MIETVSARLDPEPTPNVPGSEVPNPDVPGPQLTGGQVPGSQVPGSQVPTPLPADGGPLGDADVLVDEVAAAARTPRRLLGMAIRGVVVLAIAAGIAYGVANEWADVKRTWLELAWPAIVLAVLAQLAGMTANSMAWRAAASDLEHQVPVPAALRVCLVGGLGKYIPGSVWAYLLQMELGRRAGLPRARAFLASLVTTGLGTVTALALGVLAVPALVRATAESAYGGSVRVGLIIMIVLLPIAIVCAVPRVLTFLVNQFLRILRRPPLSHQLSWSGVLRVMAWTGLAWLCFGGQLWLLTNAAGVDGLGGLLRCVGSFALATTVGLFAVVSPSGFGVREAVLVAALAPFMATNGGVGAALGIALASRLIFTLADLIGAAGALVLGWWAPRR